MTPRPPSSAASSSNLEAQREWWGPARLAGLFFRDFGKTLDQVVTGISEVLLSKAASLLHAEHPAHPAQGVRCLLPMPVPSSIANEYEGSELQESVRAWVRIGIITLNSLHGADLLRFKSQIVSSIRLISAWLNWPGILYGSRMA